MNRDRGNSAAVSVTWRVSACYLWINLYSAKIGHVLHTKQIQKNLMVKMKRSGGSTLSAQRAKRNRAREDESSDSSDQDVDKAIKK